MRIVPFSQLVREDFMISKVFSAQHRTAHKAFDLLGRSGKKCNGFLYIEKGEGTYSSSEGNLSLRPGMLVYIPVSTHHRLTVKTRDMHFTKLDFLVNDQNGEPVCFSNAPVMITESLSDEGVDILHHLNLLYASGEDTLKSKSLLLRLFSELIACGGDTAHGKVAPAVNYIRRHFCEKWNIKILAKLCNLSQAQFYRLFHKETAQSPLDYRNSLRIERACLLLGSCEHSIGEIAEMLGFESIYYFSRAFKKIKGLSPSAFRRKAMC